MAQIDRRQLFSAGGAWLAATRLGAAQGSAPPAGVDIERLFALNADVLPEAEGYGANHYPMAAEALEALGHAEAIPESWASGAKGYAGELGPPQAIEAEALPLGDYARYGDWLALFRSELSVRPWREVLNEWSARLAPGLSGALFHGLIRTGHACRALRFRETVARKHELAAALAYWAARATVLPTKGDARPAAQSLAKAFDGLAYPHAGGSVEDITFFTALDRITQSSLAAPVPAISTGTKRPSPRSELTALVHETTTTLLEMIAARHGEFFHLHAVTGPAAAALMLPDLSEKNARILVDYTIQAALAIVSAYGAPHERRAHLTPDPPTWNELLPRIAASGYVHTIKLTDALVRFDTGPTDALGRRTALAYFES